MESQDDLCTAVKVEKYHSRSSGQPQNNTSISRFKTLLGAEIAAHIDAKRGLIHEARSFDKKSLENLTGPKFPTRKGSNNNLQGQRFSPRTSMSIDSMVNKKLELSHFLDEVTHVLDPSEDLRQCT
jgi:hypothetical protein